MKISSYLSIVLLLTLLQLPGFSQQKTDTIPSYIKGKESHGFPVADSLQPGKDKRAMEKKSRTDNPYKVDSMSRKKHDPRKATLYSTFFPGLGQIYNRKYWKLPLVYAAVGIPVYTYFYNKDWYNKCQYALVCVLNNTSASTPSGQDSLNQIDPKLMPFVNSKDDNSLRTYRNEFRKDQDYSVIFFLLFYGLQIVDATVDAHLMDFDVSNELTMHIRAMDPSAFAGMRAPSLGAGMGVSLVFDLHKTRTRTIPLP
jgi:hypothetical protein